MKKPRLYQYKPDLSIRFSPRVPVRLRNAVNRLCKRHDMPEVDVVRYGMEAVTLLVASGKMKFRQTSRIHLEAMVTIRTSQSIARKTRTIFHQLRAAGVEPKKPHHPQQVEIEHADVLRGLIGMAVDLGLARGMAHVMALREKMLR